jgi:cell division septation protein DedD
MAWKHASLKDCRYGVDRETYQLDKDGFLTTEPSAEAASVLFRHPQWMDVDRPAPKAEKPAPKAEKPASKEKSAPFAKAKTKAAAKKK